MDESNGNEPRIKFGPEPNHVMPASWVEPMLRYLFARNRKIFGDAMMAVALGENGELYERAKPGRKAAQ